MIEKKKKGERTLHQSKNSTKTILLYQHRCVRQVSNLQKLIIINSIQIGHNFHQIISCLIRRDYRYCR